MLPILVIPMSLMSGVMDEMALINSNAGSVEAEGIRHP